MKQRHHTPEQIVLKVAEGQKLVLHRANSATINGVPARGDTWTIAYRKVCAPARDDKREKLPRARS